MNASSQKESSPMDSIPTLSAEELERINSLSYEAARDELIEAVGKLEAGGLDLADSLHQWEIGQALASRAEKLLNEVRSKLEEAQKNQASASETAGTQENL